MGGDNESEKLGAGDAAAYLGVTTQRLSAIRRAKHEAGEKFGQQIAGRWWVYTQAELDAYKTTRNPQGGRPPGSKIDAAVMTPISVA